jgi:hypothetical protein
MGMLIHRRYKKLVVTDESITTKAKPQTEPKETKRKKKTESVSDVNKK